MKICLRLCVNTLITLGVAAAYVSTLDFYALAQGGSRSQIAARRAAEADLMSREWNLTHIGDDEQFKKEQISLFPQIKEDFKLIQIVNNDLMKSVFVKRVVDYKLISGSTEEINKRAKRLEKNLALPEGDQQKNLKYQPASDLDQLKVSLLSLDGLVMSFVKNPMFNSPSVINAELAETARRDLESIIKFSDAINRDAAKVSKSSGKLMVLFSNGAVTQGQRSDPGQRGDPGQRSNKEIVTRPDDPLSRDPTRPDRSEYELRTTITGTPSQFEATLKRGRDAFEAKPPRLAEAEKYYLEAAKLNPKEERPYLGLGTVYAAQEKAKDAIQAFQKAIELKPKSAVSHFNLGVIFVALGQQKEAVEQDNALESLDENLWKNLKQMIDSRFKG